MSFKNHRELFQALLDGKKVAMENWFSGSYIYLNENGEIMSSEGFGYYLTGHINNPNNWHLYEEPKQLKKIKVYGWVNLRDGSTVTDLDSNMINYLDFKDWKRAPKLDKEIEYEE